MGEQMPDNRTRTVSPIGGAGLFDIDPDQREVSQDPDAVVTGDLAALPEDMEL
jgi:hypothetical protein